MSERRRTGVLALIVYRRDTNSMRRNTCPVPTHSKSISGTALIDGRGIIAIALGSKCAFKRADLLRPLRGLDNHIHLTHRHKLALQQDHQPSSRKNNSPEIQQTHDAGETSLHTSNGHGD